MLSNEQLVSDRTYFCRYEPSNLKPIRNLGFVKWAEVCPTHFIVSSRMKPGIATVTPSTMTVFATHPHTVDIVFYAEHEKNAKILIVAVAKAAYVDPRGLSGRKDKVRLVLRERYLKGVTKINEVQSILEVRPNKLSNNVARNILVCMENVAGLNDIVIGSVTLKGQDEIVASPIRGSTRATLL